jgi:hypothetical protein
MILECMAVKMTFGEMRKEEWHVVAIQREEKLPPPITDSNGGMSIKMK